jgi:hypothetical protein
MYQRGTRVFCRPKKPFFWSRHGLKDFKFLFLGELGTSPDSPQNHTQKAYGILKKHHLAQRNMLKFTYKSNFLTIEKAYEKFLY